MNGTVYAGLFLALMMVLPYELGEHSPTLGVMACIIHTVILAVVMIRIGNDRIDFWKGLVRLSTSFQSGCANITLIYIFPVLFYYYLNALVFTIIGFYKGKAYTEDRWCALVAKRLR